MGQSTQLPASQLHQFLSPDGRCSLMMPGIPQYQSEQVPLKTGENVQMNEYYIELENKNVSYMLMYNDYRRCDAGAVPGWRCVRQDPAH